MTLDELRAGFGDPPVGCAPMMRWWWFGPSVDRTELDRELTAMAAAGVGGVEVAYVYPLGPDTDTFLSPTFLADLRYAADAAHRLGLRFDLTLGSGWSFGGPHITAQHAARQLHWDRREIGPGPARVRVVPPWPGDELIAAYLGAGSLQESPDSCTRLPVADGVIDIPDGTGTRLVLLAYSRLTGQSVKRAAYGAEGPVLDHYSVAATEAHLREVGDPLLDAVPGHLLGSVFCDSLEVYGSDWTPDFVAEFRSRRGYDALPTLYLLHVDGPGASQLRADYHRTLTDLYEDHFVAVIRRWAVARGVRFRIQGYGTPPAMISSYRGADLFEGEGWGWTELTQTRWASSAAHLYGRDVVSSEIWTWVHSPSFRATPLDLKGEAHEHLLAGINQFVGHGWPYSPPEATGLGWLFYASGALDDRNPWWPAMPALMRYLTRLCWLMRQGAPVADVLVYVGERDVLARMGRGVGGSLDGWAEARRVVGDQVIRVVRQGGWDYDLVDDDALAVLPVDECRPLIISGATGLSAVARGWLESYGARGGRVVMVDSSVDLPEATSCTAAELAATLTDCREPAVSVRPPTPDIGVVHRRTGDADLYLVANTGASVREFSLSPALSRSRYEEWDAEAGQVIREGPVGDGILLTLHPYESRVLVLADLSTAPDAPGGRVPGHSRAGGKGLVQRRVTLQHGWHVQFADRDSGVAVRLPHRWESDPERLAFSGSAVYRTTVELGELTATAGVLLDFGEAPAIEVQHVAPERIRGHSYRVHVEPPVGVVAEVRVNGVDCGVVWSAPYAVDVGRAIGPGMNTVEVTVHNTAANALAHDPHLASMVADSEQLYGRRFRMQELDRAMEQVRSGLFAVPTLVITE